MLKVAIIDDDELELKVLSALVEDLGFKVAALGRSGADAFEICRKATPDVLIMDVRMPVKDGLSAARELASTHPLPIVLLTGAKTDGAVDEAISAGVMAFLSKPVRQDELLSAIELSVSRFAEARSLRNENDELKKTIESRKLVERAKGVLIDRFRLGEAEAFAWLRNTSMDNRMSVEEVARTVIGMYEGKPR